MRFFLRASNLIQNNGYKGALYKFFGLYHLFTLPVSYPIAYFNNSVDNFSIFAFMKIFFVKRKCGLMILFGLGPGNWYINTNRFKYLRNLKYLLLSK